MAMMGFSLIDKVFKQFSSQPLVSVIWMDPNPFNLGPFTTLVGKVLQVFKFDTFELKQLIN